MLRSRRMRSLQTFAAAQSRVCGVFDQECNFSSRNIFKLNRAAALAEWRRLGTT